MQYKNILCGFILFIILNNVYTQEFIKIENADIIILQLSKSAKQLQTLKGDFKQTKHLNSLGFDIISEGSFLYKKQGDKILWKYTNPTQFTVSFIEGEFNIQQEGKNNIKSVKQDVLFSELNRIILNSLSGNIANAKGFNKEYFENQNSYLIRLTPSSSELSKLLVKLEIYFNKTDTGISEIKLFEQGKDITSISFLNIQNNLDLPDALFRFE